jgi:HlyD family secretion protein
MTRTMIRGSTGVRMAAAVSLALVVSAVAAGCGGGTSSAPTAKVSRGTVANKVSASGALAAVTSQNLAFPKGAQLKEVDVKVGDRVAPGQVLAKLDDFAFRQALNQQQAQLDQQQALLDKVVNGNQISGASDSLDQAKKILDATQDELHQTLDLDDNTVDRAQTQLKFDQRQADLAWRQYQQCQFSHRNDPPSGSSSTGASQAEMPPPPPSSGGGLLSALGGGGSGGVGSLGSSLTGEPTAEACQSMYQAALSARRQAVASRTDYEQAKKKLDVDKASGQVAVENARQGVVTAQNTLDSAHSDKPADIDAQQALVDAARAQVALAQKDVDNAVLYAPVAGTVSAINGSVGEFVGSGGGTTAKAPGTNAGIPGVGAAATSDASSSSVTGAPSATRPGGQAFIILNDVNSFQVVVPFEESDAAKVKPNQKVEVSFDAIPDLTVPGTVLSIAPSGTAISGVTNYYATILLNQTDPRLKAGQTAEAGVLVNAVDNVLVVPNSAVIKQGGRSLVSVPGPDGKPVQVPFQPGAVGDDTTQVVSGLHEGQEILLPQAQVQGTPGGGGGGGGGR